MRNRRMFEQSQSKQSGVVLFVALILLLILSMIGVTLARMQTVEERMARNENSRQLAEQAAEAALRNGETTLLSTGTNVFSGNTGGFYYLRTDGSTPVSQVPTLDWSVTANVFPYNGPALTKVPKPPKIVMEELGAVTPSGEAMGGMATPNLFRVTVQASNADGTPSVILQSIYTTN